MRSAPREAGEEADVCLIVEGAYPYVIGGVSGWLQDLITYLPEIRFHVVAIKAGPAPLPFRMTPPANVVGVTEIGPPPPPWHRAPFPIGWPPRSPMR